MTSEDFDLEVRASGNRGIWLVGDPERVKTSECYFFMSDFL